MRVTECWLFAISSHFCNPLHEGDIRSITLGDQDEVIYEETVVWKLSEPSEGLGGACKMTEESAIIVVVMPTTLAQTEAALN